MMADEEDDGVKDGRFGNERRGNNCAPGHTTARAVGR